MFNSICAFCAIQIGGGGDGMTRSWDDGGVKGGEIPQGGSSVHKCNEKIVIHVPA